MFMLKYLLIYFYSGCMDGGLTLQIAKTLLPPASTAEIVGTDINPDSINYATTHTLPLLHSFQSYESLQHQKDHHENQEPEKTSFPKLTFQTADLLNPPPSLLSSPNFDLLITFSTLHWIPDLFLAFQNIKKLLKPHSGALFIGIWHGEASLKDMIEMVDAVCWTKQRWRPFFQFESRFGEQDLVKDSNNCNITKYIVEFNPYPWNFLSESEFHSIINELNFEIIKCHLETKTQHFTRSQLFKRLRGGWVPYWSRVPEGLRDEFIEDLVEGVFERGGEKRGGNDGEEETVAVESRLWDVVLRRR
jgi:SAM-dependent methyltransferase